ncbi:MAG: hypothetical protein HY460_00820 [Parcubacteria group bacterium]|nr:hypothetical protein [Parcubacteria group bacterium]
MLGATHIITGGLVGVITQDPLAAIAGGLASHYAIDMIPHWDYSIERIREDRSFSRKALPDVIKIAADNLVGLAALALIAFYTDTLLFAFVGGFFGALPDILWGFSLFSPNRFLAWHARLHNRIHTKRHLPAPAFSLISQALLVLILVLTQFW